MKNLPYFNEFISDSLISESLNSFWSQRINEIGHPSHTQDPLDWERLDDSRDGSAEYRFYLGPSSEYIVKLHKTLWSYPINVNVEFYANGDRDNVTNEGYPLLVMATVIAILKNFLRSEPEVKSFSFVPSMENYNDNRRLNLYLKYIEGHFKNPIIKKEKLSNGYVAIVVNI